jgi:RNA polymerase sigma-70 factor (ECF subfamily)
MASHADDGDTVADRESLSLGFLMLLERLSPAERAAIVLHEGFDYTHAEIAELLGMPEATVRQHLHRAHAHVRLFGAFLDAIGRGDLDGLRRLLADDVVAASDSGGKVRAARKELHGPDHVARLFVGLGKKAAPGEFAYEVVEANGAPALLMRQRGTIYGLLTIHGDEKSIHAVLFVVNPEKLSRFSAPRST